MMPSSARRRPVAQVALALAVSLASLVDIRAAWSQATPEGPSTLNGAWTMRSFPPVAFPESRIVEAARLAREADQMLRQGRPADALQAWKAAVAIDPSHPSAYWRLASVSSIGNAEKSALIHQQVKVAPSPPAYLHGAFILQMIGHATESLAMWREGVRAYPEDRNMAALFGEALLRRGLADEAVPLFEREVLARPESSRLRLHLGRAYLATGDPEAGLTELRLAGRLEDTPLMWRALARILAISRLDLNDALIFGLRMAEAAEADSAALQSRAPNALVNTTIGLVRAWDVLSLVHAERNEIDAATDYGLAAWRLAPDVDTLTRLGGLHRDAGDREAASTYFARAAARGQSPAAIEARRVLQTLVPAFAIEADIEQGRTWAQQSRVTTFATVGGQAVRATLAVRTNREGRVIEVMPTGSADDALAAHLAGIERLTLPRLPTGATVDQVLLPWNLSCDANGACGLSPVAVPRTSPFDVE